MKVYTVSDLHADYPENMDWVLSLNSSEYKSDIVILAGDISHDLNDLERVLLLLLANLRLFILCLAIMNYGSKMTIMIVH